MKVLWRLYCFNSTALATSGAMAYPTFYCQQDNLQVNAVM